MIHLTSVSNFIIYNTASKKSSSLTSSRFIDEIHTFTQMMISMTSLRIAETLNTFIFLQIFYGFNMIRLFYLVMARQLQLPRLAWKRMWFQCNNFDKSSIVLIKRPYESRSLLNLNWMKNNYFSLKCICADWVLGECVNQMW